MVIGTWTRANNRETQGDDGDVDHGDYGGGSWLLECGGQQKRKRMMKKNARVQVPTKKREKDKKMGWTGVWRLRRDERSGCFIGGSGRWLMECVTPLRKRKTRIGEPKLS